jgi:hypothetical protein
MRPVHLSKLLFFVAFCGAAQMSSCRASHIGPRLIEADGVSYMACGGALWVQNEKAPLDNEPPSYDVLFVDAEGKKHELKRVRFLKVSDLPSGTPACRR